jgi:RNA-directed DNA polymerase
VTILEATSRGLAFAFLDGNWDHASLLERGQAALADEARWLPKLCERVLKQFAQRPHDAREVSRFIEGDNRLQKLASVQRVPRIRKWFFPEIHMAPVEGPLAGFDVPPIETTGALAAFLGVTPSQLDWFADTKRRNAARVDGPLRHYRYRWVPKRRGGHRLLETPKPRLAAIQRRLLSQVFSCVPPSAAAHGFVRARSALTFVAPHVGRRVVLRMDLEDFFSAITLPRVRAILLRVGYPQAVAHTIAALCCVPTPEDILRVQPHEGVEPADRFAQAHRLRSVHLAQGAPTSPALSNLVAFRLDRRLAGLARSVGVQFTRYADDLAFSGDHVFERGLSTFIPRVAAIAFEEGFQVRFRKTRVMRAGVRQHLAGVVINQRINVPRVEFDALRALLHNAVRLGAASQNRRQHPSFREHLIGRIAWFDATNPQRGARLRKLFEQIEWPEQSQPPTVQ